MKSNQAYSASVINHATAPRGGSAHITGPGIGEAVHQTVQDDKPGDVLDDLVVGQSNSET